VVVEHVNPLQGAAPGPLARGLFPLAARVWRRINRLLSVLAPVRLVAAAADALDERGARRRRRELGRRGLLLSWQREPDGRWKARLSGPGLVQTLERTGRSRRRAIDRSARALDRLPALRARICRGSPRGPSAGAEPGA
jgi:hypothetical protein